MSVVHLIHLGVGDRAGPAGTWLVQQASRDGRRANRLRHLVIVFQETPSSRTICELLDFPSQVGAICARSADLSIAGPTSPRLQLGTLVIGQRNIHRTQARHRHRRQLTANLRL